MKRATKTKTKAKQGKKLKLIREIVVVHLGDVTGGHQTGPCSNCQAAADEY